MVKISVILATYNRNETLTQTLESLCNQTFSEKINYEILVVDNSISNVAKDLVEKFISRNSRVIYLSEPKKGKSNAINKGILASKGEVLAFTDDDVIIDENWLSNISDFISKYVFDAAGGRVTPLYPPYTPKWVKDCKDILAGPIVRHDYGDEIKKYDHTMLPFLGANLIVKKRIFKDLGLFNTNFGPGKGTLGDDTEFFYKIQNKNGTIFYNPKILVLHPVEKYRMSLTYIAKWSFSSGKYSGIQEYKSKKEKLVCYFGVPRYLIRVILENLISLFLTIGRTRKFIKNYRNMFIGLGMACGYLSENRIKVRT